MLVVQADNLFHAVPISLVPIDGQPLWKLVRSIRVSASLLGEAQHAHNWDITPCSVPNRLVAAGWFKHDAPSSYWREALRFFMDVRNTARDRSPCYVGRAFRNPKATTTELATLTAFPTVVAGVIAHGTDGGSALWLGPEPDGTAWDGGGVDLSRVEFVLLVSCAVGRLVGGGGRDVKGLVIRMILAKARSVLSARWSIEVTAAVEIATQVIREYIALRHEPPGDARPEPGRPLAEARLRALALARTRAFFESRPVSEGGRTYEEYLNVLAAFEVFGLG